MWTYPFKSTTNNPWFVSLQQMYLYRGIFRFTKSPWYDGSLNLLCKLKQYGIRGVALDWFFWLDLNKTQFTHVNNASSTVRICFYWSTQGYILWPLLFLIYINGFPNSYDLHNHPSINLQTTRSSNTVFVLNSEVIKTNRLSTTITVAVCIYFLSVYWLFLCCWFLLLIYSTIYVYHFIVKGEPTYRFFV